MKQTVGFMPQINRQETIDMLLLWGYTNFKETRKAIKPK